MVVTDQLDIGYVGIISAIPDEVVTLSAIYTFKIFTATCNLHPW